MSYYDIYNKRLNRYGLDYQSRIQHERQREFDDYLLKTVYRVDFEWEGRSEPGSLERKKQDESETQFYLLTRIGVKLPSGTILTFPKTRAWKDYCCDIKLNNPEHQEEEERWMVYYLENIKASGYNRYIMLKMTHFLTWTARDGSTQSSWAYMYGQENNMLKDELKSRSRRMTLYNENLKLSFFVMPRNQYIRKDIYLVIGEDPFQEYYRVTGYDIQSSPGVEYVSIDPVYEFDLSAPPEQTEHDNEEDFFWFNGGIDS